MNDAKLEQEIDTAIEALKRANDLLTKIFNLESEDDNA